MKVKIYTSPTCQWCDKTKEFFKENNVEYEEVDVVKDPKGREEVIAKSGQMGVPVTLIGGKVIVGFDEDELKKALKLN